jgi:hypothetical protein
MRLKRELPDHSSDPVSVPDRVIVDARIAHRIHHAARVGERDAIATRSRRMTRADMRPSYERER